MRYDVAIIGGGLAGCSAAIQLAEQGRSVLLLEKERYPVHKLCGEFLSVEVQGLFKRLGVIDAVLAAGAHPIDHACVTTVQGTTFESPLPGTALGLSRYRLDQLLFDRAAAAGADAHDGTPVTNISGSLDEGFRIETRAGDFKARMVLGAYGKRSVLDRKLARPFLERKSPFVAFKAHYKGVEIPGTIELHSFSGGYCGISGIEGGCVNVCWIAREDTLKAAGGDPEAMIDQSLTQNPALAQRFAEMERVSDRFIAVSQVTFVPKGAFSGDVCMIGDTAGMIAPMCGDGMAMALRGAELAVPLAARFLDTKQEAAAFRRDYARAWQSEFGLRMRLGRWMHHGYCHPTVARLGVAACHYAPALGRWFIRHTRG